MAAPARVVLVPIQVQIYGVAIIYILSTQLLWRVVQVMPFLLFHGTLLLFSLPSQVDDSFQAGLGSVASATVAL